MTHIQHVQPHNHMQMQLIIDKKATPQDMDGLYFSLLYTVAINQRFSLVTEGICPETQDCDCCWQNLLVLHKPEMIMLWRVFAHQLIFSLTVAKAWTNQQLKKVTLLTERFPIKLPVMQQEQQIRHQPKFMNHHIWANKRSLKTPLPIIIKLMHAFE